MRYSGMGVLSALFVALLPFVLSRELLYGSIDAKYFFVIGFSILLLLFGAYGLYTGKARFPRLHRPFLYAIGAALAVEYATALTGVHPARSLWSDLFWMSGAFFLTHAALIAVLLSVSLSRSDWALVRRTVALSAGLFGVLTIIGVEGLGFSGRFLGLDFGLDAITFGNATYAGVYLVLAFIVGAIELSQTSERKWRRLLFASLAAVALSPVLLNIGILLGKTPLSEVAGSPAAMLGGARASSATLILLLVFLAGRSLIARFAPAQHARRLFFAWSAAVLVGIVAGITLLFTPGSFVQDAYIKSSTAARLITWESGMEAFRERPLLGWGPENFNHALERHFDNRLFLNENLGEIWFERAHNLFVDTLVTTGALGMAATLLVIGFFLSTVYRARKRELIGETEAMLLFVLPVAHVLQLQTGFDTISSYALLAVIAGYALWLEGQFAPATQEALSPSVRKGAALVLAMVALVSAKTLLWDELSRQIALTNTFTRSSNAAAQEQALRTSLGRTSSFESLRVSSASFLKGALAAIAAEKGNMPRIFALMDIYEAQYEQYLSAAPDHYRARMNYAYLLLIRTTLGQNKLATAKEVIRDSYRLSPNHPLTYVLDSLAELYGGNLREADRLMKEALALNPDIEFTQEAAAHLEKQKKQFPNITVLKIGNL